MPNTSKKLKAFFKKINIQLREEPTPDVTQLEKSYIKHFVFSHLYAYLVDYLEFHPAWLRRREIPLPTSQPAHIPTLLSQTLHCDISPGIPLAFKKKFATYSPVRTSVNNRQKNHQIKLEIYYLRLHDLADFEILRDVLPKDELKRPEKWDYTPNWILTGGV